MATQLRRLLVVSILVLVVGTPLVHKVVQELRYRNLHVVEDGVLLRSGQLNAEGFERVIREQRIGTVISFRETVGTEKRYEDAFEEDICRDAGVQFHRFSYLDWGNPDGSMPARANIDKFLAIMDDPNTKKPVLVHCFAGIHRTGVHVASYRVERQGWSNTEAWTELMEMGSRRSKYKPDLINFVFALKPKAVGGPPRKP